MDPKGNGKPSLALILAAAKPKAGGGADSGAAPGDGYTPSPECVKSVQHLFEAGADGDYESAARALSAAIDHIKSGAAGNDEASEPEGDDEGY